MSGFRGETFSRNVCGHCTTVDNEKDGEVVCIECGLVLHPLYMTSPWTSSNSPMCTTHQKALDFIRDVGENACIPANVICYAENYYEKIKIKLSPKFKTNTVAAYALYESLNKFEVPRMAEEMEHYSGVKMQHIWQVETSLSLETPLHNPKNYVSHYCNLLNLCYADQVVVCDAVDCINQDNSLGNLRCNCLVGVVIYLFCKEKKKKVTLKKICEKCDISATSIHRVVRQLRESTSQLQKNPTVSWMFRHVKKIV